MRFVPTRRYGGVGCHARILGRCFTHDNHRYALSLLSLRIRGT
jgi:hypothetical protein